MLLLSYKGFKASNEIVEIGYSVLPSWQCRGYATEIVNIFISRACSFEETNSIIAHKGLENIASKKVVISNGFREVAMNDGMLSFEYTR